MGKPGYTCHNKIKYYIEIVRGLLVKSGGPFNLCTNPIRYICINGQPV